MTNSSTAVELVRCAWMATSRRVAPSCGRTAHSCGRYAAVTVSAALSRRTSARRCGYGLLAESEPSASRLR
jgi:hypothetical protein